MQRLALSLFFAAGALVAGAPAQAPGAHWTRTNTPSDPPLRRENPGVSDGTYMYVFGGNSPSNTRLNDLWRFDGSTWVEMTTNGAATSPAARDHAGITWDFGRNCLVVFGGRDNSGNRLGDTWEWDPITNTWTNVTPASSPPARDFCALAYDSVNGKVLLFAGLDTNGIHLNDTWHYDGATWTQLNPAGALPPVRRQHVLVERPDFQDIILCGGQEQGGAGMRSDTWKWDGGTWTQIATTNVPAGKVAIDAAYDQIRQRIVIAGGNPGPTGAISEFDSLTNDWVIRPLDTGIYKVTRYFMAYVPALGKTYKVSGQSLNSNAPPQYTYEYQSDFVATWSALGTGCAGTAGNAGDREQRPAVDRGVHRARRGPRGDGDDLLGARVLGPELLRSSAAPGHGALRSRGCSLYTSLNATYTIAPVGGFATWSAAIPADTTFAGLSFYNQGIVLDPAANELGLVFSDYGTATIGVK